MRPSNVANAAEHYAAAGALVLFKNNEENKTGKQQQVHGCLQNIVVFTPHPYCSSIGIYAPEKCEKRIVSKIFFKLNCFSKPYTYISLYAYSLLGYYGALTHVLETDMSPTNMEI